MLGRSSRNSSMSPSRDSPEARKARPKKQGSGRKQGGQEGHQGRTREMVADPARVETYWPGCCGGCGALVDRGRVVGDPACHQVWEIAVSVEVSEHRRMRTGCECGHQTLADLPAGVPAGAFGPAVAAAAATLTAARISRREVARLIEDLCGVKLSPASVEALLKQTSQTLQEPYVEILQALDQSSVRGADETSWPRGRGESGWLSVSVSEQAALFQIAARRDREAAIGLLGEDPGGTIVTDRYSVYLYIDDTKRQLCLAHVLRDFIALSERSGAPGRHGTALKRTLSDVFKTLKDPGRDPRDLTRLRADLAEHRQRLHDQLEAASRCRDPKTRRFATGLLTHETALWTFTSTPGVPATNNISERALRHAVLWRKQSYGTQTDHGERLVERLLTMRETCRLQGRRLHDYLTTAITASLHGQPIPAPLPP